MERSRGRVGEQAARAALARGIASIGEIGALVLALAAWVLPGCGGAQSPSESGGSGGGAGAGEVAGSGGSPVTVDVFDDTRLHEVELTMAPEDWQSIIDDTRGDEWRRAALVYDGVEVHDVGARPSGESSRFAGNAKMSIRLKFDAFVPDGSFQSLEELKLDGLQTEASLMRERLAYFVLGQRMPAPRKVHTRLVVNGESRGLYSVEEVWDDEALEERFTKPLGPLYRLRGVAGQDPYQFRGADPALYVPEPWDAKGQRPLQDHAVIGHFLERVAAGPAAMEEVFDVELFLEFLAGNAIITNIDGLNGSWEVDDHFQYYDPASGKFKILAWDPDNSFGSISDPPTRSIYENFERNILTNTVRETPALRQRFRDKLVAYMDAVPPEMVQAKADEIFEQIKDAAHQDTLKEPSNEHFDYSLTYIKEFVAARYANLREQARSD